MKTILSQKGQVVIPKEIREKLKLEKGSIFEIELQDNLIILKPVGKTLKVRHWKELRGLLKGKYSTRQFLEKRKKDRERESKKSGYLVQELMGWRKHKNKGK